MYQLLPENRGVLTFFLRGKEFYKVIYPVLMMVNWDETRKIERKRKAKNRN
jgi:hypothetical protein